MCSFCFLSLERVDLNSRGRFTTKAACKIHWISMHATALLLAVQGNCTSKPPSVQSLGLPGPEIQWKAPQCLIIGRMDILYVDKNLWIDSLYLRRRPSFWFPFYFIRAFEDAVVYTTNSMLQGNGPFNSSVFKGEPGSRALFHGAMRSLLRPSPACRCLHCRRRHMHTPLPHAFAETHVR